MNNKLQKSLGELVDAGVIPAETAQRIQAYYQSRKSSSANIITIVFSIIGAALVGLGIILVIAHNWDHLSRGIKTTIAFLPLISGQLACAYTLLRKKDQPAWSEGSATFLFLAIGASISMVSQIYNIEGTLSGFLFTWMLLGLPLVYVMKSSMASLLYISGITYYAVESGYFQYSDNNSYWYWLLLLLIIPHIFLLLKNKPGSNFTIINNWIISASLIISLGTIANDAEQLLFPAYMSLFAFFYLTGDIFFSQERKLFTNPYKLIGSTATICLMMVFSFHWFWDDLNNDDWQHEIWQTPEFIATLLLSLAAGVLLLLSYLKKRDGDINPVEFTFLIFLFTYFFVSPSSSLFAMIIMNLLILYCGIYWIRSGAKQDHFGILNYGLMIILILTCCRFFDDYLSFIIRGFLFVGAGLLFFAANYSQLRKRKNQFKTDSHD
ncbi:MAG: DUF2157 domain-containing protein [Chitinophagaceae bacterium]|nr:DUF2157 domain-containing protein [Chitinophagaceae bacterium]